MRSKRALLNTIFGLLYEAVLIVSGFLLPRYILLFFGSSVNGIVNSVTQFLSIIALLRSGVGGVTKAALYAQIKENNRDKINAILSATQRFMRKISFIFAFFAIVLACSYSFFIDNQFSWFYSFSLVLILAMGTFVQYYFGITYEIFLEASQKMYIWNIFQTIATAINIAVTLVLIFTGNSIQVVKLGSSLAFMITPIAVNLLIKRKYKLNLKVPPDNGPIKQRWNAFGHQIARYILENTDIITLTFFVPLSLVSVYSVYALVIHSCIRLMIETTFNGFEPAFGDMLSRNEKTALDKTMTKYEYLCSQLSTFAFSATFALIFSFVNLYTKNVNDANYYQPIFGLIFILAEFSYTLRLPYYSLVVAAGHYKQTSIGAYLEAALNVGISLALVSWLGLVGIAIGTLIAMLYRSIDLFVYVNRHLLPRKPSSLIRYACCSICCVATFAIFCAIFNFPKPSTLLQWALQAAKLCFYSLLFIIPLNIVFCKKEVISVLGSFRSIKRK